MTFIRLFIVALLYFFIAVINISCQREYSYEGGVDSLSQGLPPAKFNLQGEPNSCFDFSVRGNYNPGMPLTIDNSVLVMVNVLSTGSYSIKTPTINGISFASSGNFLSTGSQALILQGSGTPLATGQFSFNINSSASACSFDVNVSNADPPSAYELATNPDGMCSEYLVPGSFYHGTPLNNSVMLIKVKVAVPGNFSISTNTLNGITFSLTGKFRTTGLQSVTLIGRGTPKEVGIFSFTPKIVGATANNNVCSVDVYVF